MRVNLTLFAAGIIAIATGASAQTPQPFPRARNPTSTAPQKPDPAVAAPATGSPWGTGPGVPTPAMLGAPVYPSAVFLTSYDAGRGQRFYLFGSTIPYAELVIYYKTLLKEKGEELFESPPTHQFETARFRDESMAFAPSVTIKDYTYGGSAGYPNLKGGSPERFPTVIQIVPAPTTVKN
ncbi:MAG: hypothetical protein ACRD96_20195 [Bryobacteraceae bacterium]